MIDYDVHIRGGTIVDGIRVPRYRGDVWIRDGRIAQLGGRPPAFEDGTCTGATPGRLLRHGRG